MPGTIQANTACEESAVSPRLLSTCEQLIAEQIPNLYRLYLNPHVIRACYYLAELVGERWPQSRSAGSYRVFLTNSGDEALSGAIKLARYVQVRQGRDGIGVVIAEDAAEDFAVADLGDRGRIEFLPDLVSAAGILGALEQLRASKRPLDFAVIPHGMESEWLTLLTAELSDAGDTSSSRQPSSASSVCEPLLISCTGRDRFQKLGRVADVCPDIVVFDGSLTRHEVPFGAFAARRELLDEWQRGQRKTFHSTTFQPNSVASLHFARCLAEDEPELVRRCESTLSRLEHDRQLRFTLFEQLYSRPLARLMRTVDGNAPDVRAAGHYVSVGGRPIFDAVAGVACSLRGHNPPDFVQQLRRSGSADECRQAASGRLFELTGLPHVLAAVSGASAVEAALKIALASQFPRDYVLAFRGGFGGKTLFALTGTWKDSLRRDAGPLYPKVVFVDPFASDAVSALEQAFSEYPIGVVQLELVQGVGGVREIPQTALEKAHELCRSRDALLFVDEVQTGMFRTGPFTRSGELGLLPDVLTIGKATSDMMLPSSFVLYSDEVRQRLHDQGCDLAVRLERRHACRAVWPTLENALRWAVDSQLERSVRTRSQQFAELLQQRLKSSPIVRDVRCYGLLIGIELAVGNGKSARVNRLVSQLQILGMYRHREFPVLAGFCQYEPNVLKVTPPLTTTESEAERVCWTMADVLRRPWRHSFRGIVENSMSSMAHSIRGGRSR